MFHLCADSLNKRAKEESLCSENKNTNIIAHILQHDSYIQQHNLICNIFELSNQFARRKCKKSNIDWFGQHSSPSLSTDPAVGKQPDKLFTLETQRAKLNNPTITRVAFCDHSWVIFRYVM